MRLPSRLQALLKNDPSLHGCVLLSIEAFEPILRDNKMPFFPEYTDHGIDHVESVMLTADALISDDATDQVSAGDATVLILACLLHDIAMHLSEDGFISLITPSPNQHAPAWKNDRPWQNLWLDFLGEASRFDGRKLISLFGNSDPITRPSLQADRMTKRDRLLIGEFLRRHHHRLAHETAIHGFAGPGDENVHLMGTPEHIAKLAGIVARSHGMPVRTCIAHLEPDFDRRETYGVHPPFLMTILRVADYLQIEKERAPNSLLKIRRLLSPTSMREWATHNAIEFTHDSHEDPEAVFIRCRPSNVKSYLRVSEWLSGIQQELDSSWAVLGELYGRYKEAHRLGLTIRRVRSNIDDTDRFASTVDYVPTRATFQAADADLLKLLIGPLYGNCPEIALRELVQNAVDAVRELREYVKERPQLQYEVTDQPADVLVLFEEDAAGSWSLTVSDTGIGMTAEIIEEYYLKAGASYRSSDAWRNRFEEQSGHPRVLRSGRFGVGVLATFLLGRQIEVTTRHVDSPAGEGISFKTDLEDDSIELRRIARPVGTTVRVPIAPDVVEHVRTWFDTSYGQRRPDPDGYCLADPSVMRVRCTTKHGEQSLGQRYILPKQGSVLSAQWHRIRHPDYPDIHWTYSTAPGLACNGIVITGDLSWQGELGHWTDQLLEGEPLTAPRVSVFDPNAKLPVNLQRDDVTDSKCPFGQTLLEDVARDLIAFTLVRAPTDRSQLAAEVTHRLQYPGLRLSTVFDSHLVTEDGFSLPLPWHLHDARLNRLFLVPEWECVGALGNPFEIPKRSGMLKFDWDFDSLRERAGRLYDLIRGVPALCNRSRVFVDSNDLPIVGGRAIISPYLLKTVQDEETDSSFRHKPTVGLSIEPLCSGQVALSWGQCDSDTSLAQRLVCAQTYEPNLYGIVVEWFLDEGKMECVGGTSVVERIWQEVVGQAIIPYCITKRKDALAHAYGRLQPYIRKQEVLLRQETREALRKRGHLV